MLYPLVAIGLLSLPLSIAQSHLHPRQATCTNFSPDDDRGTWNTGAHTPTRQLSSMADCRSSSAPCLPPPQETENKLRQSVTMSFHVDNSTVNVNMGTLSASRLEMMVGAPYKGEIPVSADIGLYVPPGQAGYLVAYAEAVEVPGWIDGCDDGGRYRGSALLPSTRGLGYRIVVDGNA